MKGETMATLTEVKKQLEVLRSQELKLEAENFKNSIVPKLEALVGKTFVYRNNSCGGGRDEKFDTFRKLLRVAFSEYHAWGIFEECQIPSDGRASIELHADLANRGDVKLRFLDLGWQPCAVEEYEAMRQEVLQQFANPEKHFNYLSDRN